ncbi:MAG: rRNA cytosine-C5-methyltransferase [Bacteroides sp.]|uniref:methyltransferase RsmF C-terminal domain-like protein n=1 Tax=Bacteroides sp. TaxID=29523 RepID=UPI002FC9F205
MNLPAPFALSSRALLGDEEYEKLAIALQQESPVSVRLNEAVQVDAGLNVPLSEIPWSAAGHYLEQRLTFTFDPLFHAGCYYVQEASSMFVEQALKRYLPTAPVVMLDLCAAPGGKSTHARSVLPQGSLLVANEVVRNRSQILAENLTKWGHPDVVVTNNDPADFTPLTSFFDVILTDVPCSGEGMFRKDPNAVEEWSPENVTVCWQRQQRILSDIWPCLRPGGMLIYSTCTYNTKENEENVRWMCEEFGAEVLALDVPDSWNITGNLLPDADFPVYRFLPHRTQGEGFFLAVVRKPETASAERSSAYEAAGRAPSAKRKNKKNTPPTPPLVSKEQLALAKSWLLAPDDYELSVSGSVVSAFTRTRSGELASLSSLLRIVQAGVTLGEAKGKDLIPNHALAMSRVLKPGVFPTEEVSYDQAIAYLRKEAISLSETAPRGYVLLLYKQVPLGFVKNIGNRANNLYPQEWRIRSGYLPDEIRTLF